MQRALLEGAARRQSLLARRSRRAAGLSQRLSPCCTLHVISSRTAPFYLNRIRVVQLRCFSSTDNVDLEIERLTGQVLNHNVTQLGAMPASLVDDCIAASQHWCASKSGYGMESADRLLQRLMSEHASGASAAQHRTAAIAHLQLQVLKSWLTMSSYRLALERAEAILSSIVQWYEQGISTHNPYPEMVTVVEASLPFPDMAASLLLQWTQTPDPDTASELVPLFNATLESCIHQSDAMTAAVLLQRMETLEIEHQWENLDLSVDARKLVLEGPMPASDEEEELIIEDESSGDKGIKHLSDFELQAIQARFMEFLNVASPDDKKKVLEMAKQLNTLPKTELTVSMYKTFMDYFIRIEDVKHATQLLSRMDVGNGLEQSDMTEDLFLDILRLWVKSQDVDAPWRAQEVVKRMEELENLGLLHVTTRTYNILCEAWAQSADPSASNKVEAIFSRMLAAKENFDLSKSPDLDTYKLYLSVWPKDPDNHVTRVVSEVLKQGAELSPEEFTTVLENSLEALSTDAPNATVKQLQDRGDVASKLFRQAVSQDISITPTMCVNLIKPQQFEVRLRELDYLEKLPDIVLPLECYELVIMALLDARRPAFNQKKLMVARTLKRYADGKISAQSSDVEALMIRIMEELVYQGRPYPIDAMLRMFEDLILSDEAPAKNLEIPVECFNSALTGWRHEGDSEKVEETFNRLLTHYKAGHASLLPSADTFAALLYVLLSTNASAHEIAAKATKLMEDMLKLYEATGSDVCKPNDACFHRVLTALSRVHSKESAEQAWKYLRLMLSMRITPSTSAFNKVMYAVATSGTTDYSKAGPFSKMEKLLKLMEKVGAEPDVLTYKNILRICNSPIRRADRQRALSAAMDVTGKLRKAGAVDAGSYGMLARTLREQLHGESLEKRDKLAYTACSLCFEDGFLTKQNADLFQSAMSMKAWGKLTEKFRRIHAEREAAEQSTGNERTVLQ